MASSILIYRKEPGKIGELKLDVTISEEHQYDSDIAEFPIEKGGNISDHIINKSITLNMVGFITNSPIKVFGNNDFNESNLKIIANRVQSSLTLLTDMREAKELFTVVTGLKVYRVMFFKSLIFLNNKDIGDTLRFTAVLTQVHRATSKKIERQNLDPGTTEVKKNTQDLASEKINRGGQTVTESTKEQKTRISALKQIVTVGQ